MIKILTISFFDDNFGDMLIRICSDRLLTVALKNLDFSDGDFVIDNMHIIDIDREKIASADLILFSGGAMFGFNNLGSYEAIDAITSLADEKGIPVVFSSLGINHMSGEEEHEVQLNAILRRKCVKAMSVRETVGVFAPFADGCCFEIVPVCDPAVWAKHVYRKEIKAVRSAKSQTIVGLNIVRGGLFKANLKDLSLDDELNYIMELTSLLEDQGIDYRLFTNGSVLDGNSLMYIANRLEIPQEKCICPDSSKELVRSIAGFDAVLAIRMHAGILSYALDIPSANLVWNEKIPHFYQSIGYPDRAVELIEYRPDADEAVPSLAQIMAQKAGELLADHEYHSDSDYLMSLYRFLYETLGRILKKPADSAYTFESVSHMMSLLESGTDEDITDYRTKLNRSRYCYRVLSERSLEMRYRNIKLERYLRKIYRSPYYRSYHFLTGLLKSREKITCRPAEMADLDDVRDLFSAAIANLQIQNIPQWDENYPTDADFTPDIKSGRMRLVYKGDRLAGVFTLTEMTPGRFRAASWSDPGEQHLTLLRFAVHPDCEGFGFPKNALALIVQSARESGARYLRADICPLNPREMSLYRKMGFVKTGETMLYLKQYDLMELSL